MDVLERLDRLIKARGWSMYRLAKESGLSESTVANIYRRNAVPSIDTLEKICQGLGITLAQFFADGEMVEMTPELKEVFEYWRGLTAEQKAAALTILRVLNHDKTGDHRGNSCPWRAKEVLHQRMRPRRLNKKNRAG